MSAAAESDGRIAQSLLEFLQQHGIAHRVLQHPPTATAEESARVRGTAIEIGAKTLLLRTETAVGLFVLSAARQLDNARVRRYFSSSYCRFAHVNELYAETGLVPGAVPPFGKPILPYTLYADHSILEQPQIAFNAGLRSRSILMSGEDWQRCSRPIAFEFSKPALSQKAE